MTKTSITVWRFMDGKAGHEKQSQGLIQGLETLCTVSTHDLVLSGKLFHRLKQTVQLGRQLRIQTSPQLLIGAGHRTHLPMLLAKKLFGGLSIVLMKPSLPALCFDFSLIPVHDKPGNSANIIATEGALAPIKITNKESDKGIILIGGLDKRIIWNDADVWRQVNAICAKNETIHWQLTTSRRTPESFLKNAPAHKNLELKPWHETPPNWLVNQLAESSFCWVSQDSVSMLYEALGAQNAVGIIELEGKNSGDKISRNVARLIKNKFVTPFSNWQNSAHLTVPPQQFQEHIRCAELIMTKLHNNK
ncbi:MAG: mitochondrial fission ELM1 family protein [Gammaproteobacteria bacterium]|nr:mitochondrial fission ELM1 family protein [Gammaproteobacteria bacterium]